VFFAKYYYGIQIKEDDTGRACNTNVRDEKFIKYLVGKPEGKRLLGLYVDGKI
jgi:hypothetical protein